MTRVALSVSVVQRGKSGVATYIFGLLEGFRRIQASIEPVIIGLEEDRPLFEKWGFEWIPVSEAYRPALKNVLWHQACLPGLLRRKKVEVLHIPSYRRIVAFPPCPQVVTIHDCAAFALQGKYDIARMFYGRQVVPWLATRAKIITTVSQATAKDVARYFRLTEKELHVIWNGLDHDFFRPPSPANVPTELAQLAQTEPYFIYLARLEHPAKNHVRLIEAFEQFCLQNPLLRHQLLLGGADWHGADVIHQRIEDSPFRARIRKLGFVAKKDLPIWYAGATAMVYPSLFEGFGLPPIEAMACGCPVISSTRGALGEVVGNAAELINPESPDNICSALQSLALEPETRACLIQKGLARATEFSWEHAASQLCDIYRLAVEKKKG